MHSQRLARRDEALLLRAEPPSEDAGDERLDLVAGREGHRVDAGALRPLDPRRLRAVLEADAVLARVAPLPQRVQVILELRREAQRRVEVVDGVDLTTFPYYSAYCLSLWTTSTCRVCWPSEMEVGTLPAITAVAAPAASVQSAEMATDRRLREVNMIMVLQLLTYGGYAYDKTIFAFLCVAI